MRPIPFLPFALSLSFAVAALGCSQNRGDETTTQTAAPNAHMQVRHDIRSIRAYEDMYLSRTIFSIAGKVAVVRRKTKTLPNQTLVIQVTVMEGEHKGRVVWVLGDQLEFKNQHIARAFEAEARKLALAAERSGREAVAWQNAANAARLLCVMGTGANAALSVVTMGANTVGKGALVILVGANTLTPLLKCAGIKLEDVET